MEHLYARMPNGKMQDFGPDNAALATSLPSVVERDILVASLVTTKMVEKVGVGNVGEFPLRYEIRDSEAPAR